MVFFCDDGCDVGEDNGAPVSPDYGPHGNAFTGRVKGVQIAITDAAEAADHKVSPEEAIRIAMARQEARRVSIKPWSRVRLQR
ncbi:hypothetical protein [Acidocella sp.]|uniref:hypothetical protein n=1 Tax=Acidocella sp. TaxID=50710 RepID=UPI002F3FD98F